ncbi:MAG: segregation/condensation protein A [Lachnospiraceae bacterium]|nr:segregation/condensation protein A [Lachnospiraceae bacterium]
MGIQVKLEAFEGPLDLLLHLIEKNKIDIYDIPIASIADQYIEYVNAMETKDMDVMSDFLVMAATLLNIKSRMLLPVDESLPPEEQDPRYELVQRLLEYKMCKYMAEELKDRQLDADRLVFKAPDIPEDIADFKEDINLEELLGDLTLNKLQEIFRSVVKKQVDKIDPVRSKFGEIKKEEISLEDKIGYILECGKKSSTLSFRALLEGAGSKLNIIVSFLAVLELIKMGIITVSQDNLFDDINICFKKDYNINYENYDFTQY